MRKGKTTNDKRETRFEENVCLTKTSNVRKKVRDATTYSRVLRSYFIKRNDNMALKQLKI